MALVLYMPGMVETEAAAAASASVRQRRSRFAGSAARGLRRAMASRVPQGDSIDEIIRLAESKVISTTPVWRRNISSPLRPSSTMSSLAPESTAQSLSVVVPLFAMALRAITRSPAALSVGVIKTETSNRVEVN